VTVGIPAYNEKRFIGQAIESVLTQTFADFELLISDDASSDGTAEICAQYAARDRRIRLVRQKRNLGPFLNLKYVTDHAAGTLLVWLAHDDMLASTYLEECVTRMKSRPQDVLVSSDFEIIDETGKLTRVESLVSIRADIPWRRRRAQFFRFPVYSNIFYCFYGMMKTEAGQRMFARLGKPKYMSQIELPVLARLATMGEISSFPRVSRYYRRVSTSLYHTEQRSIADQPRLRQIAIQALHFGKLMADQVATLLRSSVPGGAKIAILLHLIGYYSVTCPLILARGRPADRPEDI
jgi:glycosyltransferase involved in cell wall biosynthesis